MCKYCESKKSEHFLCDSCGNGMCDDCYDSNIEHFNHTCMDTPELEEELPESSSIFLCVDCYSLFIKQTKAITLETPLMPS